MEQSTGVHRGLVLWSLGQWEAAAAKPTPSVSPANTVPTQTNSTTTRTSTVCSCPSDTQTATTAISSTPTKPIKVAGFLRVLWRNDTCVGDVILYHPKSPSPLPVCWSDMAKSFLENVCEKKDCEGPNKWKRGSETSGAQISEAGANLTDHSCVTLTVHCTDVEGQQHAYKVVIALLSCVLLVILLIRFTRPTVEALQRRFSDRRQNRWIGPTQSHSVSYHRGKAVKNDEREKRLSYPALERLAVSDSREPSSNRNSGCNY
ncbi:hypothetical protein INR49_002081 [Caranx melampygus]|nr:hypothetical protein INR49_002081 [Caranx melampygus]